MRDIFIAFFDLGNADSAWILKIVLTVLAVYFAVALVARYIRIIVEKAKRRDAQKTYRATCDYLYFGCAIRKSFYARNVLPLIATVASVPLYACAVNYKAWGIADNVSNVLFIIALVLNGAVFIYYFVRFIKDAARNEFAFSLTASIPYGKPLTPDDMEGKWDYGAKFTESGAAVAGGKHSAFVKFLWVFFQVITVFASVVIYALGRMLRVLKPFIIGTVKRDEEKRNLRDRAVKLCKKYIMRGVFESELGNKDLDPNHPANLILRDLLESTQAESFEQLCKGIIPEHVVANYSFDPKGPKSVIAFSGTQEIYKEQNMDGDFMRRILSDKDGNLLRLEVNTKGECGNAADFNGLPMYYRQPKAKLPYYELPAKLLTATKMLDIYKWMSFHAVEYASYMQRKKDIVPVLLFFSEKQDGATAYSYKTVYVPLADIIIDDYRQNFNLPTVKEFVNAV
ncbi:MAG: hypothetical protein J1F39_07320 [Clostridiales bacterium]|nr:hypothetical protein [Clostridiales bacterium]